jgi:hypothetical protein
MPDRCSFGRQDLPGGFALRSAGATHVVSGSSSETILRPTIRGLSLTEIPASDFDTVKTVDSLLFWVIP